MGDVCELRRANGCEVSWVGEEHDLEVILRGNGNGRISKTKPRVI